jgi:uncharacterized membrane protein (UPF0182 family)
VPHLSILFFVLVASWGWGFYLDHFELLYSTQGVVYGAGYTAEHVTRIAFWIMIGAAMGCGFHTGHEASSRADSLAQRAKCQLDCGSPSVT